MKRNKETKLLILDIDETLVYASEKELSRRPDFMFGDYHIYKRPYLEEFLELCFKTFNVAIWTSSTQDYAQEVIERLAIDKSSLSFLWARNRCTLLYHRDSASYVWLKNLKKGKRIGFSLQDVIFVDDSPEKHMKNYGNLVPISSFEGHLQDNDLFLLSHYLPWLNLQPDVRSIDKRLWKAASLPDL